jgi:hypothetical protein
METTNHIPDALSAFRNLTLADLERRLADLDAERAQLSSLRRSFVARERAKRRAARTGKSTRSNEEEAVDGR